MRSRELPTPDRQQWWKVNADEEETLEKLKAAEAILTDKLARGGVKNIDEHVLVWMAGEKTRENFYEVFFFLIIRALKSFTDVEPVRPFCAIEPHP